MGDEFKSLTDFTVESEMDETPFGMACTVRHKQTNELFRALSFDIKPRLIDKFKLAFSKQMRLSHPGLQSVSIATDTPKPIILSTPNASLSLVHALGKNQVLLSETNRMATIFGVAATMRILHSHGIVHGFLRPTTILETEDFKPLVTCPQFIDYSVRRISTKDPITTNVWIAPEVFNTRIQTKQADVYSFGILLLWFYSRKFFFGRVLRNAPFVSLALGGHRPVIPELVSLKMRMLIEKCWSLDPKKRPTFDEICVFLYDIVDFSFKRFIRPDFDAFYQDLIQKDQFLDEMIKTTPREIIPKKRFKFTFPEISESGSNVFTSQYPIESRAVSALLMSNKAKVETLQLIHLQTMLMTIDTRKRARIAARVLAESNYCSIRSKAFQLAMNILTTIRSSSRNIFCIADFIAALISISPKSITVFEYILDYIFDPSPSKNVFLDKIPLMTFLVAIVDRGLLTEEDLYQRIKAYPPNNDQTYGLFFCFFCNIIAKFDRSLHQKMLQGLQQSIENPFFPDDFRVFMKNYGNLTKNNYRLHHKCVRLKSYMDPLKCLLAADAFQEIKAMVEDESIASTTRLETDIFEPLAYLHNHPPIILACVFFQSIQCFQYLQIHHPDILIRDRKFLRFPQYAIAGGCQMLIDQIRLPFVEYDGSLQACTLFHRNAQFHQIFRRSKQSLSRPNKQNETVMNISVAVDNVGIFVYLLSRNIGRNPDEFGVCFLFIGHRCIGLPITDSWIFSESSQIWMGPSRTQKTQSFLKLLGSCFAFHMTPLHIASRYGNAECVFVLLNLPDADPNFQDLKGMTPLHHAVESRCIENVVVLLSSPKADQSVRDNVPFWFIKFLLFP